MTYEQAEQIIKLLQQIHASTFILIGLLGLIAGITFGKAK